MANFLSPLDLKAITAFKALYDSTCVMGYPFGLLIIGYMAVLTIGAALNNGSKNVH